MRYSKNHRCFLFTIVIGTFLFCFNLRSEEQPKSPNEFENEGLVAVDALYVAPEATNKNYALMDYQDRREKTGTTFSIMHSTFDPINYQPKFSILDFEEVYGLKSSSGIEVQFSQKNNYSFYSFSYEFGIGIYSFESLETASDVSTMTIYPIFFGAKLSLDTFFKEPYFVPFAGGGAYIVKFEEVQNSNPAYSGNTQPAGYFNFGFSIQLDWIDMDNARLAYEESGIENTSIIIEGKKYFASSNGVDPNYETGIFLNAGIQMEF